VDYFPDVGHTLRDLFGKYWHQHGEEAQFGLPITEEFREVSPTNGETYLVQYFQRARFELHPEYAGTQYEVLLGLLGHNQAPEQGRNEVYFRRTPDAHQSQGLYFPNTGHNLDPKFVDYWNTHGGLPVFGEPISEPFQETNRVDGTMYLVQYFERNRFELHSEPPAPPEVLLGLMGVEELCARYSVKCETLDPVATLP
jgi:hypothetical protein